MDVYALRNAIDSLEVVRCGVDNDCDYQIIKSLIDIMDALCEKYENKESEN